MQITKFEEYCKTMLLDYQLEDSIASVDNKEYKIIEDGERVLFTDEFDLIIGPDYTEDVDGYIYEFGGRWYVQEAGVEKTQLKEFKYVGNAITQIPTKSFLGLRTGYELMNGIGLYKDYVEKAKFLGVETLGICERKTLSGVILFQNECTAAGIKSVTGLTIPIKGEETYDIKLYVRDFQGWLNLLKFNEKLNVNGDHHIDESFLIENSSNLFVIADPKSMLYDKMSKEISERVDYYQLDLPSFLNEERDTEFVDNLEKWITSNHKAINIQDAFYLEKREWKTREILWAIGKAFDDKTNNQYFKSRDEFAKELIKMFSADNKSWVALYKTAESNAEFLAEQCNFIYDTNTRHLPRYKMTEEEQSKYKDNADMFLDLIKEGFKFRGIKDASKYIDRLKVEIEVLKSGDVIDYFLSLYDIVQFAKRNDILTGLGRGSAGGSLVAYLLDIIQIDPLEFDLLFERFLNSGRMGEWVEKPFFTFIGEDGEEIGLAEGALVRVNRDDKEMVVYCHEVKEGDTIISY